MSFKLPALHKDTIPFSLGAAAGAILAVWIGFDALHWNTAGTTETLLKRKADTAMVDAYARICSTQYRAAADFPARLAELQKVEQWSRGEFLAKTPFVLMPGDKEPVQGVAQACADLLVPKTTG